MKELSKEQKEQIEAEAKKLYPDNGVTGNPLIYGKRIGYTAAASKYLLQNMELHDKLQKSLNQNANDTLRIKELEDGLREIMDWLYHKYPNVNTGNPDHMKAHQLFHKAKQLLTNK